MKESVAIAKEADRKKDISSTRSGNSIHRVQNEPERQLGSLRGVIGNITRDGGTPSANSIATELSSMHTAQRASVLLALQRTHGNLYVQRIVTGIQAKLKVGQPGDIYEQEADRVADAVMHMSDPQVQRQPEEEEEEELIQTKPLADPITPLIQRPIEVEEEEILQTRFGIDFSGVRLHTDSDAAQMSRELNAEAFTYGRDIYFGGGRYNLGTSSGKRLLAHELTHLVQQRSATTISSTPLTSFTDQIISRYPRSYAQAHLDDVRGGHYPHLRLRGLDVDREIARRIELALVTHDRGSGDITRITGGDLGSGDNPREGGWICEMTEISWGATGIRDMRLVYIDDELRTVRRAWRVQNDTVTELSEPGIEEAYQLISQDSHELAGERARVLTTLDPDQLRDWLRDVFDMTSDRGWHHIFPQSTIPERRIGYSPGRANRRSLEQTISSRPSLGERHYTHNRVAIGDSNISAFRELVINVINRRLASIHTEEALADRGPMILWHTPETSNWGWFYAAGSRAAQRNYPATQRHREFLRGLTPNDLGLQGNDLVRWQVYSYLNAEGDTSAINAYDTQRVTIGSGFGAQSRRAGRVYNYMPPQFRERLYMHGILVNPDNTFTILDLNRGVVEHGDNALRILQVDERRLGLLVHEAQSEREITHEGETREQRLWMVRAQMLEATREIPDPMLSWRSIALLKFAIRCNHWQPSTIPYRSYLESMPENLNVIARRVRDRIWERRGEQASGDYSCAEIESRMRGWARAAGAGQIEFEPPESPTTTP
jgi:hypothetical protein